MPVILPGGQDPASWAEGQRQSVTTFDEEERMTGTNGSQISAWYPRGNEVSGQPVVGDSSVTEQVHASLGEGMEDRSLQHGSGVGAVVHQRVDADLVDPFSLVLDGE